MAANLHRGIAAYWLGEPGAADWLTESHREALAHPEPYAAIQAAAFLALIARDEHRYDDAERWVALAQQTTNDFGLHEFGQTAIAHYAEGLLALDAGRTDAAHGSFRRAGELAQRIHSRPVHVAALLGLADVALVDGDRNTASDQRITAAAELADLPAAGTLSDRLAVLERRLRGGGQLPPRPVNRPLVVEELTERELAVLRLLPGRLTQREIGEALHLSMNTVKTHMRNIFRKLSAASRDEAVENARSVGLL